MSTGSFSLVTGRDRTTRRESRRLRRDVDLHDVASAADAQPDRYGVVVVGASLHRGHHQTDIADWGQARRAALEQCPSVFLSVSLSTRQLMRLLMLRMGHPTDASHDHDYTDWDAVDRLGREIAMPAEAGVTA